MSSKLIKTIQQVSVAAIAEHALQIMFGKVESNSPLVVKISDHLILTEEFLVLDSPVDVGEDVIVIKYSVGNKYLVLCTVEKVYEDTINQGGIVNQKVGD